jgi:hypothetical protein
MPKFARDKAQPLDPKLNILPQSKDARGALMLEETLACVACGGMLLFTVIPASYDR